jgi:hypothetical protein
MIGFETNGISGFLMKIVIRLTSITRLGWKAFLICCKV